MVWFVWVFELRVIYIYIFQQCVFVMNSLGGFVADQIRYYLESA